MRKLKLDLDCLVVESFDTRPARAEGGTVFGQATFGESCEGTCYTDCWGGTCPNCDQSSIALCTQACGSGREGTCDATCATCGDSCNGWRSCIDTCVQTCWESCYGYCFSEDPCEK